MAQLTLTRAIVLGAVLLILCPVPVSVMETDGTPVVRSQTVSWSSVGLGDKVTVLVFLEPDCAACVESMAFFKRLMTIPGLDGKAGRVVVIARNGVIPVKDLIDAAGFKPHRLTSGPAGAAAAVQSVPAVLLLDGAGQRAGLWNGQLTEKQQQEVTELITRRLG